MDKIKLDRISELSRKSRETPLSEQELSEQAELRKEYISAYRSNLKQTLDNIKIVEPTDKTVSKIKPKGTRKRIHRALN